MTVLLGFAAVNTGNNLLYLLVSVLLGFLAMTGVVGYRNLGGFALENYPVQDFFAGLPGGVGIRVINHHRTLPLFLLRIECAGANALVPYVAPGGRATVTLRLSLPERGLHSLPPVTVTTGFPVNFIQRSRQLVLPESVLVYPRPLTTELPVVNDSRCNLAQSPWSAAGGDGDLRSIDTYRPGDPLKAIHWKLSARHQDLKVKQMYQQGGDAVIFNPEQFAGSLEERLSRCAFLVNRSFVEHRSVGLRLKSRNIPPAVGRQQQLRLLKELALYEES